MAIKFGESKGQAQKSNINQYTMKAGDNRVRLVGDLLPRYVYWIEGENNKNIPFECLSFDRQTETFNNKEKDWVREFYPDLKCGWAYAVQCIDPDDGEVKVFNLKKKLMEQILTTAEDLGDPTDPETGWDICFKRVKTGPLAYNIEYQLQVIKCQQAKGPLTDEQREAIKDLKSMDEIIVRPTPDAQKELLERLQGQNASDETTDQEAISEFDADVE